MQKLIQILFISFSLAATSSDIYDNSWALIIGIDKYQNVQKLNYAVDDAESMKNILIDSFNFQNEKISFLTNEEATKQNILKSFSNITKQAEENDRVLVFFAGHGETMDLPEGGEKGYLIPVEGDSDDLYLTAIPMDELKQIALMSRAKHMLYLVDACYGGIAAVGSRGLEPSKTPNYIDKITKRKARQVITAGGRGEKVIEKPEWGHSAFTLNLNRGLKDGNADLNSDGYITANELGLFLSEKVTIDSENQQTPQYGRMTSQEGEFVFINNNILGSTISSSDTDAKLNLLLSEIAELKQQPLASTPNPDISKSSIVEEKVTETPFLFSFLFLGDLQLIFLQQYLDERSSFGSSFLRYSIDGKDIWGEDEWDYNHGLTFTRFRIAPTITYDIWPSKSAVFNPIITAALNISMHQETSHQCDINDENLEDAIYDPEHTMDGTETGEPHYTYFRAFEGKARSLTLSFSMVNQIKIKGFFYDKLGFTFGVLAYQKDRFEFDANETLSTVESPWEWGPMILFSIKDPLWNYKKK